MNMINHPSLWHQLWDAVYNTEAGQEVPTDLLPSEGAALSSLDTYLSKLKRGGYITGTHKTAWKRTGKYMAKAGDRPAPHRIVPKPCPFRIPERLTSKGASMSLSLISALEGEASRRLVRPADVRMRREHDGREEFSDASLKDFMLMLTRARILKQPYKGKYEKGHLYTSWKNRLLKRVSKMKVTGEGRALHETASRSYSDGTLKAIEEAIEKHREKTKNKPTIIKVTDIITNWNEDLPRPRGLDGILTAIVADGHLLRRGNRRWEVVEEAWPPSASSVATAQS